MTTPKGTGAPVPDASTVWELWYYDTFDRESPPSLESSGEGILQGLYQLWQQTLKEGIQDNGSASFSYFQLTWGRPASTRVDIGVQPFDNPSLLKLRRWARFMSQDSKRTDVDLLEHERHTVLNRLAQWHLELLLRSSRWNASTIRWSAEAEEILAGVRSMTDAKEL